MTLRLFKEKSVPKFFNAQYKGYGRIDFNFNQKIDSLLVLQWFEDLDSTFDIGNRLVGDESKDTLSYWFVPPSEGGVELQFLVYVDTFAADTVGVFVRETKKEKFSVTVTAGGTVNPDDTVGFRINHPISYVGRERVQVFLNDTVPVKADWYFPKDDPFLLQLIFPRNFDETYKIIAPDSSFVDIFGQTTDTITATFKTGVEDDFGKWIIAVELDTGNYILEVLTEKNQVVKTQFLQQSKKIIYPYITPAKYKLRLIVDENANKQWDPGSYLEGKQPEVVHYIEAAVEVRANWEIETNWDLKAPENPEASAALDTAKGESPVENIESEEAPNEAPQ
jgi:hypothetical protein